MDVIETVEIKDEHGSTINYSLYKGHVYPPHVSSNIRDLVANTAQLKCRQDDVLLYTYPKSGTHWMYNILHMFLTGKITYAGTPAYLEFHNIDVINSMASPRLFATHLEVDLFPEDIKNGIGRVFNIIRNPKDVAVSYYCFLTAMKNVGFTGDFTGFLHFYLKEEFFFGNWFASIKQWIDIEKMYPKMKTITLYYEDLKRNTLPNLERVVRFLGIPRDDEFCKNVMANTDFTTMKQKHEAESKRMEQFRNVVKDGILPVYRKGDIGDWKRWFTPAQSELFDRIYKERLAGYNVELVFD
ncbi:sulfotransferase 1A1-like [Pecten maximus]|uniref:sulfotransferase 1A1-like n=1 Tax=Pecten maximus TaxID=6579 RepID=UPI001458E333|nr:sulfotransferase 1A1-like [Pecten maximus]XP_033740777.1 sulfotransferase 1A1-like [Pecten maximus]